MRFKLDENLPVELASDLRGMGYDVETVYDEGFRGAADPAVVNALLLPIEFCSRSIKVSPICSATRCINMRG